MLRRRFLVNEEVAPDFIIIYYAPQHIPFSSNYKGVLRGYWGDYSNFGDEDNTVFKCVSDKWKDGIGEYGIQILNWVDGTWYNAWGYKKISDYMNVNAGGLGYYTDIVDGVQKDIMNFQNTITDVIFPNEIKHLKGIAVSEPFDNFNHSVVNVILPENLETLSDCVLHSLHALKTITIPSSVVYMGLQSLQIDCQDDNIMSIVTGNYSLEEIIMKPMVPPSTDTLAIPIGRYDSDKYINPNLKIRVYTDCIDKYKNDSVWGQYSNLYDTINNTIVYYNTNGRQLLEQLNDFINVSNNSKLNTAISIYLPNSVTSIGGSAFSGCSSLTSITIGNSVTSIGAYAFKGCKSLTSIVIGNSVTSIGGDAFRDCSALTEIVIPNSVTSVESRVFYGCKGLTSVTIGNSVKSIGYRAFYDCNALTSITIPNSVTSIGKDAFYGCSGLTSITIPNSVTSIGEEAFLLCISLISITIPNSVTSIGDNTFSGCTQLASIVIGNGVKSIGNYAFYSCKPLTSIVIPDSVKSIGKLAFTNCSSLIDVTIGNNVTSIGEYAFSGCISLTSITFNGTKEQWNSKVLGNSWKAGIKAKVVHCTDGDVEL